MKKAMKVLGILLCAVLLVVGSVAATLAYLTAKSGTVTNTFTVGNVALKLTETQLDENGAPVLDADNNVVRREEGNSYHLISGNTYTKDPIVTVTINDKNTAYVRMMVEMEGAEWFDIVGFLEGYDEDVWYLNNPTEQPVGDVVTYEFRYAEGAVDTSGDLPALFTAIDLKDLSTEDPKYQAITNLKSISVEAHAIQSEGFEEIGTEGQDGYVSAEDVAWEAFDDEYAQAQS